MSYLIFIDRFIHPFIIYVLAGTLVSYLGARWISKISHFNNPRAKAMLFTVPFLIPFLGYFLFQPFITYNCIIFKKPLGIISNWLCSSGRAIATILTPLFFLAVSFAVIKAIVSLVATNRIIKKNGYAQKDQYPHVWHTVQNLSDKAGISMPKLIITKDSFARSFTMGRRSPIIVLSEGLLNGLDDEELETVIAHEIGHIVRGDSLLNWIMVFLRDIMFFTPLSFFMFRELSAEKENASDDFAVTLTGKPYAFAQAIIKVWRMSPRTLFSNLALDNFMPQPNFAKNAGVLESRVKRIVEEQNSPYNHSRLPLLATTLLCIASLSIVYWLC